MKLELQINKNSIFVPLKNKWYSLTPEEKLKQEFIIKLVNHYGYTLNQLDQDVVIKKNYKADIAIWKSNEDKINHKVPTIIIAVECKADYLKIKFDDYLKGYKSAGDAKADFFIAANLKETKVFKVIKDLPYDSDVLKDIPNANIITSESKIKSFLNESKIFTRDEFSKLLFRCHNIIRNNDKLSPEAAFDEISKILFMKIYYEKNPDEEFIFSLEKFKRDEAKYEKNQRQVNIKRYGPKADIPYMEYWFDQTKDYYKDDELFDDSDKIKIKQASFEAIVEELEKYNLSDTSDDVKGIAFEEFLGRTFRGDLGQFFTPRTVVDFIIKVLDPQEGETICDPACGSGGFLIGAFEYVRNKIEEDLQAERVKIRKKYKSEYYENLSKKEQEKADEELNKIFSKLNTELDSKNKNGRLGKLSFDCIFGTDANPRMARTAKMNMIMHGDGHGGVHHHDGLLNVNGIFENRFDIVLTNPPFGSRVEKTLKIAEEEKFTDIDKIEKYVIKYGEEYLKALDQVNNNVGKSIISLFDLGKYSGLTEVLFMERCLRLLKKGGRMGIVLPEGVLNTSSLQKVRDYFESKAKILLIVSIPQDVFIASGANVKPSLLFLKKFTSEEELHYANIKKSITEEITKKYARNLENTIENIRIFKESNKNRKKDKNFIIEQKELIKKHTLLEEHIEKEIKDKIKDCFNYEIPISEIERAGITSTGAKCENDLLPLYEEFSTYRKKHKLWKESVQNDRSE